MTATSTRKNRADFPAEALGRFAAAYQAEAVVPRCGACRRPCCRLETLVIELDWPRLRALWGLTEGRAGFDARLARGEGPAEVRAEGDLYYAHGRVCPAYQDGVCRVYDTALKPGGCTDFPVYEEDGGLVADLRCEAVDLADLETRLLAALGPDARVRRRPDREFPFLVRLAVKGAAPALPRPRPPP